MDTLKTFESQPREVGTSQREDSSLLSRGGRRRHRGTKRKRIVRRDKAAGLTNPETINVPTAPIADVGTAGPSGEGRDKDSKPTSLRHPGHLPKGNEMRLYDVRQRLQVRREVLETSKVAGEQLPAPKPLPGLTAKQRRSSLSSPKDEKGDPKDIRDSKTQALPVKRDNEEVMYEHSPAKKQGHPTWRGEVVSKSRFRRMKAKSRFIESVQGAREGHATITSSANSSAQHFSQLATGLPHTDRNKSNPQSKSRTHELENLLQTDREHSKNMSNPRGVPSGSRGIVHLNVMDDLQTDLHKGRNTGRVSRYQQSSDENEPSFPIASSTSTGGARRPRGFQPSEVNTKDTSAAEQSKDLTKALTPPEAPAAKSELQRHSDAAAPHETLKSGEHTSSLIQPTSPEETRERKPSCWTRVARRPEGPIQGWDNGTQDLSQPSWKLLDAIASTQYKAPKRANMENLPPYKFPRRRGQHPAAESSSRQTAGIEKAPIQHLPESSKSPNAGTISAPGYNSHNNATQSTKKDAPNVVTHSTKNTTTDLPRGRMSTTVPPHLRGAGRRSEAKVVPTEPPNAADQPLLPQLATAAGSLKIASTCAFNAYEDTEGTATIAAMLKYEVPPHFQGPQAHSTRKVEKSKAMTLSSDDREHNSTLSKVNIDEEVAAGLNAIDHDEELAIALQAELSGNKESTPQKEHDDFQASSHQAHALQTEKSVGAKDTNQAQNNIIEATNQQEDQGGALPPHLRILVTSGSTAHAIGETSNTQGGPVGAQQPVTKPATLVGTGSNGLKDITNNKSIGQVQSKDGDGSATTPMSAVKAGKQPAGNITNDKPVKQIRTKDGGASGTTPMSAVKAGKQPTGNITNDKPVKQIRTKNGGASATTPMSAVKAGKQPTRDNNPLYDDSGLANWDGKLAPPLLGEDWADRDQFDSGSPDRKAIIEAWREDNAVDNEVTGGIKLDTKSQVFQTGKAIIGGNGDILSFIDDAAHEAIPNDDEFTQVHRERSAATAIEEFKAMTASKGKSTKSGESNETRRPERRGHKRELRVLDEDVYEPPSKGFEPEANIYLRPAEPGDMRQVTQIYNQWAVDTLFTVAKESVDTPYWTQCFNSCQSDKLPFVVAVHMGQKPCKSLKDVKRKKGETIVGFSAATKYGSSISVYRYSAELELYVHREHLRQGIGRTMLDRMLSALCQGYYLMELAPLLLSKEHRRQEWDAGGIAVVHTVTINLLHSAEEDKENIEWKKKWLFGGRNQFEFVGNIPKIGYKFYKPYVSS